MPVEIRLLPHFQLRTLDDDPNTLQLPVIEMAPSEDSNLPYISRITCSVQGTPPAVLQQIQSAYKEFNLNPPLKLPSLHRLKQGTCSLNQPLPANVNCTLQVNIEYFDSDAASQPNLAVPKKAEASCHLFTPVISQPHPVTSEGELKPKKISPTPTKPDDPSTNQVEDPELIFPGWLAIDFGTSNSTVTLFDPRVVAPPKTLPKEQEKRLRELLAKWLNSPPANALGEVSASEWEQFTNEISKNLKVAEPSKLADTLLGKQNSSFLEAIRQIEISLNNRIESFRRAASKQLNQIYHEVFRVPPLEWQNLIPIELDPNSIKPTEIKSDLEITSLDPLTVIMGEEVSNHRNNALTQGTVTSWNEIQAKFHPSPKRYFGSNKQPPPVSFSGKQQEIRVNDLLQAAYAHLKELTEDFRQKNLDRLAEGRFDRAVVTYPTKASPKVREDIVKLIRGLGISQVQTAYDEAVAVAIFFLWREFGGDLSIGIESFKTRCRRDGGDKWSQNVLILDIGGGTTDLALINLKLEEKDPFEENENRGAGGRYYELTPKLLRSSGHAQLGGELITLRVFRLLKLVIVECLLTAITEGSLESESLEDRISELDERFRDNDKFQSNTLLACLDNENLEKDTDALNAAERVLPTRSTARLQTFYTLWEHAEKAKLYLGQKPKQKGDSSLTFVLSEPEISELLRQSNIEFQVKDSNRLRVELNSQQLEKAVVPVIQEAIGIAKGLVETQFKQQDLATAEHVDWLILSGKTCNLKLVEREIYQAFSNYKYFVWNRERITFVPEYTKLATSAGACYAERLLQYGFNPKASKRLLRLGANQLHIDVKNLFYFLPCSFKLKTQDQELLPLFEAGDPLHQLDLTPIAKIRSDWREGLQLTSTVYRQDYENGALMLWGNFDGNKLAGQLNMTRDQLKKQIQVQFEVDQEFKFQLLLCQGSPHYWIATDIPHLDVRKAIGGQAVIAEDQLSCDIAVHVQEGSTVGRTDVHHLVFEAGKYDSKSLKMFRYEDGAGEQTGRGLISEKPLPDSPRSSKHTFYFRQPNTNDWTLIGELSCPSSQTSFPCEYRVTLDDQGILRIHVGEIPYWTAESLEGLKQEGCVYWDKLALQPNEVDKERDPFCGRH